MRVLKYGNTGMSGGGGNRYKCPNSPHPRCSVCGHTMHKSFYTSGSRLFFRDGRWHCRYCESAAQQAALDFPFSKPPESPWKNEHDKASLRTI